MMGAHTHTVIRGPPIWERRTPEGISFQEGTPGVLLSPAGSDPLKFPPEGSIQGPAETMAGAIWPLAITRDTGPW